MKFKNLPLPIIALSQVFLAATYIFLVANFMGWVEKGNLGPSFLGIVLMLCLLVLSASICGFLIFGYAIYLLLDKQTKEALILLGYTFLFLFLTIISTFLFLLIWR